MTELKPCPFCGGEAEFYPAACIEQGWYIATVQCVSCAAQVCSKPGLDRAEQEANESAVKSWNTRAEREVGISKFQKITGTNYIEAKSILASLEQAGAKVVE